MATDDTAHHRPAALADEQLRLQLAALQGGLRTVRRAPLEFTATDERGVELRWRSPAAAPEAVRADAAAAGVRLREPTDPLTVEVTIRGRVQGVGFRNWFARRAREAELTGHVRNGERPDVVHAVLHGAPEQVGVMLRAAGHGPRNAEPTEVRAVRTDIVPPAGFSIQ